MGKEEDFLILLTFIFFLPESYLYIDVCFPCVLLPKKNFLHRAF